MARTPDEIHDEWLVARARARDASALDELLRRWQRPLLVHAARLSGSADGAYDILQESLISIARSIRRIDDPATFRTWAYRIVSRRTAEWIRKRSRDRDRTAPLTAEPGAEGGADGDDGAEVRAAVSRLSVEDQTIITLRYQAGLGVASIAVALGLPVGTVKSRLHAARQRLRTMLEPVEEGAMR